ncbi:MAG: universal stress protein [Chloroflexota bacterium]|nr:universal stress protein [Chloroflexota bacterium]
MLVPLDGSKLAEVVFVYAKELAGRLDLDVILLSVYSPNEKGSTMHRAYIDLAAETIQREAINIQENSGGRHGSRTLTATGELAEGYPAEEILRYADENDIDLILMASHGHSGIRRWAMGSVAEKVLQSSKAPVLLIRSCVPEDIVYDRWSRTTLLVPLDGSHMSESVLPHIEALAKQHGRQQVDITLLHVAEDPSMVSQLDRFLIHKDYTDNADEHYPYTDEEYLARVARQLKDKQLSVSSVVLEGRPADEIVDYANQNHFNLIVMATHGRSGLSRWAYGSVANKVLLGVCTPLFLIRPQ